jgi:hypothetical protein
MCWSAEVSLNTYIFSLFGFFFGLFNNYDWKMLLFGLIFSSMQLVEYNLWTNLNNRKQNEFWSKIGEFVVYAECFASANTIPNLALRNGFFGLSAIYALVNSYLTRNNDKKTTVGKYKHLTHNWYTDTYFDVVPVFLIILPLWFSATKLWFFFAAAAATLAAIFYSDSYEFSSMWCYYVTTFWFIVIIQSIGLDTQCLNLFGKN